ncbi:MAG: leucine-rich repeat protein [Clostridia bacterium]|nr:leucine-rich repeat protein [Clostridia bacterium]
MKKTFKKSLAVILATLIFLTAAPLSGFVGFELPNIDFGSIFTPTVEASIEDGAILLESDWTVNENGAIAVDVYLTDCVGLKAWDLRLEYNEVLFGVGSDDDVMQGRDVLAIQNYCDVDKNEIFSLSNVSNDGEVLFSGFFSDYLWAAWEFFENSDIDKGECIVDSDKFHLCTVFLTLERTDLFDLLDIDLHIAAEYTFESDEEFGTSSTASYILHRDNTSDDGAIADWGKCGDNLIWILDAEGTLTISGTGDMYAYELSADYYPPWYDYCDSIATVVLEAEITSIGDYAFYDCTSLKEVSIPDSVTSVGWATFSGCTSLTSVTFGENSQMATINEYAFYDCTSLTSIAVPEGVTKIEENTFYNCDSLKSINIPSSVTKIDRFAFEHCIALEAVYIEDLEAWCNIDFWTGLDCNPLYYAGNLYLNGSLVTELIIPETVTEIKNYTFYNCSSLTSVVIPEGVTKIGSSAFSNCDSLLSVSIPASVTETGQYVFEYCTALEAVYIEDLEAWCNIDFWTVEGNPLYHAGNLYLNGSLVTDLIIPETVTEIKNYTFYNCSSLTSVVIPEGVTSIGNYSFSGCISLTAATIPDSMVNIGYAAFEECSALPGIDIPENAAEGIEDAFDDCISLKRIDVDENNAFYSSVDGVLYNKEKTEILRYPAGKACDTFVIPDSVTIIGSGAFVDCVALLNVTIPESVTVIEGAAFYGCRSLLSVNIPKTVTEFGYNAFCYCRSLETLYIAENITDLGFTSFDFYGCTSLSAIEADENNPAVTSVDGVLYNKECTELLWYPLGKKDPVFVVPDGVTVISELNNLYLISLVLPESITNIYYTFDDCVSLTDVYYCGSEEEFDAINCDVAGLSFDNAAKHFNYSADECAHAWKTACTIEPTETTNGEEKTQCLLCGEATTQSVAKLSIVASGSCGENLRGNMDAWDDNLTWTADSMGTLVITGSGDMFNFYGSKDGTGYVPFPENIKKVIIEEGVTSVGELSFSICTQLKEVVLPESLEYINMSAFNGCRSLESIVIPKGLKMSSMYAFSGCMMLTDVYYTGSEADWNAVWISTGDTASDWINQTDVHFNYSATEKIEPIVVLESNGELDDDGFVTVDLYLENSVGLTSFNFNIEYDPTILTYASFDAGADAKALNKMNENNQLEFNNITFESNDTGMQLKLSGYFGTGLYSTEHFNALNGNNLIDSDRFHLASIHFAVEDITANAQIDATAIFDFEGFAADGFLYPAYGMIRNLTAQLDVAIRCKHVGETEIRNASAATCSVAGYSGDTYCLVCGEKIADGEPIAIIPHTWNDGIVTIEPTCHTVGEKKYICSVCGQTKTEELAIDAANHDGATEIRNELAETCGTDGYTGDTYCLECNTVVLVGTVIPATGEHAWNNGVVTTEPTYTTFGVKTYTCTVCGNAKTESIDKLVAEFADKEEQVVVDEDGDIVAVLGTTVEEYLEQASEGTIIIGADGDILENDEIPGTGAVLILPDGTEYTIVVLGDLHGDGEILANDARTALRNSVGLDNLNDAQLKAADVNGDGVVNSSDARSILRASVGLDDPADWFENLK